MQRNLERRIAALEVASPARDKMTIFIIIVSVGNLNPATNSIRADDRQVWTRQPGESEQCLKDRASREVKRNQWGAVQLIAEEQT